MKVFICCLHKWDLSNAFCKYGCDLAVPASNVGNGRVADEQRLEEAIPIDEEVQPPQTTGYDASTEGRSAAVESTNLAVGGLGSSGEAPLLIVCCFIPS